jgi:ERCC4-type nuclease
MRNHGHAAEAVLASVPGISTVTARALLRQFGSVAAVIAAGPEAWMSIHGIGPGRALHLAKTLGIDAASEAADSSSRSRV